MKKLIAFLFTCWLLQACNDTANTKPDIDTHSSTSVSTSERARQINKAKNNRVLLPGKWQVIEARNEDEGMSKADLKEMNFEVISFMPTDSFAVYHKKKVTG